MIDNRRRKKYLIATICFVIFAFIATTFQINIYKEKESEFFNENIAGKILRITSGGRHLTYMKFDNPKREINVLIETNIMINNERALFHDLAKVGDSLYKPAYSDTIYLYRKDSLIKVCYNKKK